MIDRVGRGKRRGRAMIGPLEPLLPLYVVVPRGVELRRRVEPDEAKPQRMSP